MVYSVFMKTKTNPPKRKTNSNKTNTSGNVIRTILREELQNLESDIDQKFVTFEKKIDFKLDFRLGDLETGIDERARKYRDEILTSNDKLMKELEEQREEGEIGDSQIRKRLNILESA